MYRPLSELCRLSLARWARRWLKRLNQVRSQHKLTASVSVNYAECIRQLAFFSLVVIDQYELGSNLGYFILSKAESNDICVETLAQLFPTDFSRNTKILWLTMRESMWAGPSHLLSALAAASPLHLYTFPASTILT